MPGTNGHLWNPQTGNAFDPSTRRHYQVQPAVQPVAASPWQRQPNGLDYNTVTGQWWNPQTRQYVGGATSAAASNWPATNQNGVYVMVINVQQTASAPGASGAGLAAGAALGGALGNAFGTKNPGWATALGAIAGGFLGHSAEKSMNRDNGVFSVTVRDARGSQYTYSVDGPLWFSVGQYVQVLNGAIFNPNNANTAYASYSNAMVMPDALPLAPVGMVNYNLGQPVADYRYSQPVFRQW